MSAKRMSIVEARPFYMADLSLAVVFSAVRRSVWGTHEIPSRKSLSDQGRILEEGHDTIGIYARPARPRYIPSAWLGDSPAFKSKHLCGLERPGHGLLSLR